MLSTLSIALMAFSVAQAWSEWFNSSRKTGLNRDLKFFSFAIY